MKKHTKPQKSAGKSKKTARTNKPTLVAFLLDRTGSMADCKAETISGFNAYINGLRKKDDGTMKFTLTQFDSQGIDILHDGVSVQGVMTLTAENYEPRASTPLYDAIGKTIEATRKSAGKRYKVLFVTLTDGLENASSVWTEDTVRQLIKECEDKLKWTFAHIGVGVDGWTATARYSTGTRSFANNLHIERKDLTKSYDQLIGATMSYAGAQSEAVVTGFWNKDDKSK